MFWGGFFLPFWRHQDAWPQIADQLVCGFPVSEPDIPAWADTVSGERLSAANSESHFFLEMVASVF